MDFLLPRSLRLLSVPAAACLLAAGIVAGPVTLAAQKHVKTHKDSKRADTHEIEALEAQWREAVVQGNTSTLDSLLADDFFGISANGTVSDKGQYLQRISTRRNQFTSIDLMDIKIRIQSNTAVAVSQARVSGQLDGRPMGGVFRYTKVYGRVSGTWRVLNFEATRVSGPQETQPDMRGGTPISPRWHLQ